MINVPELIDALLHEEEPNRRKHLRSTVEGLALIGESVLASRPGDLTHSMIELVAAARSGADTSAIEARIVAAFDEGQRAAKRLAELRATLGTIAGGL